MSRVKECYRDGIARLRLVITGDEVRKVPFSSDSAYDSDAYDPVKITETVGVVSGSRRINPAL